MFRVVIVKSGAVKQSPLCGKRFLHRAKDARLAMTTRCFPIGRVTSVVKTHKISDEQFGEEKTK